MTTDQQPPPDIAGMAARVMELAAKHADPDSPGMTWAERGEVVEAAPALAAEVGRLRGENARLTARLPELLAIGDAMRNAKSHDGLFAAHGEWDMIRADIAAMLPATKEKADT